VVTRRKVGKKVRVGGREGGEGDGERGTRGMMGKVLGSPPDKEGDNPAWGGGKFLQFICI